MLKYSCQTLCRRLYFYTCIYIVNLLSIVNGIILTSGFNGYLTEQTSTTWSYAILPCSAILSPLICTYIASKCGRKFTLMAICIPFMLSQVITAIATCGTSSKTHLVTRGMTGFSIGGLTTILTLYIKELSTCAENTSMIQSHSGFFAFGVFIGIFSENLNIMALSIIAAFLVLLICFLPETPPFLIANKKELCGKDVLIKLKNSAMIDQEFRLLCDKYTKTPFCVTIKSITTKWRMKITHDFVFIVFKELSAAFVVYFFARDIFEKITAMNNVLTSKVSWPIDMLVDTQLITLGFIQFITTLVVLRLRKHITSNKNKTTTVMATCFIILCMFGLFPITVYLKFVSDDVKTIEGYEHLRNHGKKLCVVNNSMTAVSTLSQNIKWTSWIPLLSFSVILGCYNVLNVCFDDYFKDDLTWSEDIWLNAGYDTLTWFLWFCFCFIFNVLASDMWILFGVCCFGCFLGLFVTVTYSSTSTNNTVEKGIQKKCQSEI